MRPRSTTTMALGPALAGFLGLGVQLGCTDGAAEVLGPVEKRAAPLNGTPIFPDSSCDSRITKIQNGLTAANSVLRNPLMDDCARQAIMSFNNWTFPELALAQLRANIPTQITCVNTLPFNRVAQAPQPATGETLQLLNSFVDSASTTFADIAAVVLHEVLHNRNYGHPNEGNVGNGNEVPGFSNVSATGSLDFQTSINEQISACAFNIITSGLPSPNFRRRDSLDGESLLAPVGGPNGAVTDIACTGQRVAKGIRHRTGDEVDAVGLWCGPPVGARTEVTAVAGGPNGFERDQFCFDHEVLVGLQGRAGGVNTRIGPICEAASDVRAGNTTNIFFEDTKDQTTFGGNGGEPWLRQCPAFMYLRAIKLRVGARVDAMELSCQVLDRIEPIDETVLARRGGSGPRHYRERCAGRGALTGLTYHGGDRFLNRLGGRCRLVSTPCDFNRGCEDVVFGTSYVLPSHGSLLGGVAEDNCADGDVLVGLKVRSGDLVDAVTGLCAPAAAWSRGAPMTPTELPRRGGDGGSETSLVCPAGKFLVGWDIGHDISHLTFIEPRCRAFR